MTDAGRAPTVDEDVVHDDGEDHGEEDSFLRALAHAPPVAPERVGLGSGHLGRYRIDGELGRGGMGVVLAAHDRVLGRDVALKLVAARSIGDAREQRRLLREARAAAAVADPGIAIVYDVGEVDGQIAIAMERIRGRTLRAMLDATRPRPGASPAGLPVPEVCRIGASIARSLDRAHAAGLVHRDLKPENVMITDDGATKILDFGLARRVHDEVPAGTAAAPGDGSLETSGDGSRFAGTPGYAAPEQRSGRAVDGRADQWALGIVLLELATGRRDRAALGGLRSRALASVAARCTAEDPGARWTRCADVATALTSVAGAPAGRSALRRWAVLAVAGAIVGGGSIAALRGDDAAASVDDAGRLDADAAPFTDAGPVACPPLAVRGAPEPSGWLGAAAASLACRRARAHLGGAREAVVVPAALLGMPRVPTESIPDDPFGDPTARDRAIEAARAQGGRWIDGVVEVGDGVIAVELTARSTSGVPLAEAARGDARTLQAAVRIALDALVRRGALDRAERPDAEVARWTGAATIEALLDRDLADAVAMTAAGTGDLEAVVAARPGSFGGGLAVISAHVARMRAEPPPRTSARPLDATDGPSLAITALPHLVTSPGADVSAIARALAGAREGEVSPTGRSELLGAEAVIRAHGGDEGEARRVALAAVDASPEDAPWFPLVRASIGQHGGAATARAVLAWRPESADAYNVLSFTEERSDAARLELVRRALLLSDGFPLYAGNTGALLVRAGRREEARALAVRLSEADPIRQLTGARIEADVLVSEGRIGGALALVERTLATAPRVGTIEGGDVALLAQALDLAALLGREREVARAIVERFVLSSPPRLAPGAFARDQAATACAHLARREARACFARLRELDASGHFRDGEPPDTASYVEGAEAWAMGDVAGAARAFRRLRALGLGQQRLVVEALDAAAEHEIAERLDRPALARAPFAGVSAAHERAARRAHARGDVAAARALAQQVVDGWSSSDEPLVPVARMRALLRRLPVPPGSAPVSPRAE